MLIFDNNAVVLSNKSGDIRAALWICERIEHFFDASLCGTIVRNIKLWHILCYMLYYRIVLLSDRCSTGWCHRFGGWWELLGVDCLCGILLCQGTGSVYYY